MPELPSLIALCTTPVQSHDFEPSLTRYLGRYTKGISFESVVAQSSPSVRGMLERLVIPGTREHVPERQYREIIETHLPRMRRMFVHYFEQSGVAAIIFPTTIMAAPLLCGDEIEVQVDGRPMPLDAAFSRNIAAGSTAGLPGLTLPAGLTREGSSGRARDRWASRLGPCAARTGPGNRGGDRQARSASKCRRSQASLASREG